MTIPDIETLMTVQTEAEILDAALAHATTEGLDTTTWRDGDPTLTEYRFLAEFLAAREEFSTASIKAGFLAKASGEWLTVLAAEVYGVTRVAATYAGPSTITLTNAGGGYYDPPAGTLTFKSTLSGKTYHSVSALSAPLTPGATVTVSVEADEAGSAGSAVADEIDDFVTVLLGVTIDSSTAVVGLDEETDASLRARCEDTLGALSSNGPADAYDSVARNSALTGVTDVTRSLVDADSTTGEVAVWVASASGGVSGATVTAVQTAIDTWATPLCVSATVASVAEHSQNLAVTIGGTGLPTSEVLQTLVETAYADLLAVVPIGGVLTHAMIIVAVYAALLAEGASGLVVVVTTPASTVDLAGAGEVFVAGSVVITEA